MNKFTKGQIVTDGQTTFTIVRVKKAPPLGFDQCYVVTDERGNRSRQFEQHLRAA